jgi:hypothetical protein
MSEQRVTYEQTVFIDAPPETVFAYLVDPALMAQWIGSSHTLDAKPGGVFRIVFDSGQVALGAFTEVMPYRRGFHVGMGVRGGPACVSQARRLIGRIRAGGTQWRNAHASSTQRIARGPGPLFRPGVVPLPRCFSRTLRRPSRSWRSEIMTAQTAKQHKGSSNG